MSKLALLGGRAVREKGFCGWPFVTDRDREGLAKVYGGGRWSSGEKVKEFEKTYSARTGAAHTVLVSNGTVSLEMILRGLEIGCGDEVILPPYTFIASVSAVLFACARPVFADIDAGTYNISPESAEKKITSRTRAIIAVAVAGCPPQIDRLEALAKEKGIYLIIDAAQAAGARWDGRDLGLYGEAASISCQNTKNLTCGEGGIITTNSETLNKRLRAMLGSSGAADESFLFDCCDNNPTEFQASILSSQLEKLDAEIDRREKSAAHLTKRLEALPFARHTARDAKLDRHAYHLYIARLDSELMSERGITREMFVSAVNAEGIPLCCGYMPLYTFPCMTSENTRRMIGTDIDVSPLPVCEKASRLEGTWLFQSLLLDGEKDMDDIADAFEKVWENAAALAQYHKNKKEGR